MSWKFSLETGVCSALPTEGVVGVQNCILAAAIPLIHIGYHKTGSTWLQTRVFCDEQVGFCMPWPSGREEAIKEFVRVRPFDFDPRAARAAFEPGLRAAANRSLTAVISHEGLSGDPMAGQYYGREVAGRLAQAFPLAKILVCIREQRDMLFSLYRQYVKEYRGIEPIEGFIEREDLGRRGYQRCRLHHLEYDRLIACYQALFGRENVLVIPFEALREDEGKFLGELLEFLGMQTTAWTPSGSPNPSPKGAELELLRRVNRYCPPAFRPRVDRAARALCRWVGRQAPQRISLSFESRNADLIERRAAGCFAASNRRTQELCQLNLARHGYDCS